MILRNNLYYYFLLFSFCVFTQELPPIQNFSPGDYDGENQNWEVTQGVDGHIYIANNHNLLEYDGVRWEKYESQNASIFRSIKAKDSLIFTGQYMEFGYWKKNDFGELFYTSISSGLNEPMIEDEEFWNILILEDWVLFQSLDRIYSYNTTTGQFKILDAKSNKAQVFKIDDTIYFQDVDLGIYKIENGKPTLVFNHNTIEDRSVVGMYKENNSIILILDNAKFLKISNRGIVESFNLQLKNTLSVYCTARLMDGSFVLGTISNGIYQTNLDGEVFSVINKQKGLNNNTVLSVFQDRDENLWLGLDNGISVINIKSPFNEYIDRIGKLGLVYASTLYEDRLYLGTNQGLFVKTSNDEDEFEMVTNTDGQVWSLKVIDDKLFCGHNKGTFRITDNRADLISSFPGTWDIKEIPGKPNVLLQGNFNGLSTLKKENGKWVFGNTIEGFDISSRFFEFTADHQLLVNHEYKGLFGLKISEEYTNVNQIKPHPIMGYGSSLATYQDEIIYTTLEGAFIKDKDSLSFEPHSAIMDLLFSQSGGIASILLPDKKSNRLWCFTNNGLSYIYHKNFNASLDLNTIPIPSFFRRSLGVSGFENLTRIGDERYLIGISNGFVTLDLNKQKQKNSSNTIEINRITNQIGFKNPSKVSLSEKAIFGYKENSVSFNWVVPQFNKYDEVVYQYKLDGLFEDWNNWSPESTATFSNLKYGDYTFSVKGKVGNTITNNVATYAFSIQRPWYISRLALICYSIGIITLFFGVHRLYKTYYTRKQSRLIALEKKKLKRKKLKSQKELAQIKNEKLQGEIDGKNRELAVATMSMIKKNEFLNTIKEQLSKIDDDKQVKAVIKTIDKNISNEDDWKFFEEAFNNADKDFLKKIKELHSELTSNDLRLCAYLRLNLSSKEIAPLLNISVRSVEVKRYRLRKKMNLEHESGLVDYILKL